MVSQQITTQQLPRFLAGDIILFAGLGDPYSKVGCRLMQGEREDPTYCVHTAQFLSPRTVLEMDMVTRAKRFDDVFNRRHRFGPWKRRAFEVWRCRTLTDQERQALSSQARTYLNMRFSFTRLLGQMLDLLVSRAAHRHIFVFRHLDDGYPVCSDILAYTYDKVLGYRFGAPPRYVDPDQIHDWVKAHPEEWVQVFQFEGQKSKA